MFKGRSLPALFRLRPYARRNPNIITADVNLNSEGQNAVGIPAHGVCCEAVYVIVGQWKPVVRAGTDYK